MSFKEQQSRETVAREKARRPHPKLSSARTASSGYSVLCAVIRIRDQV